MANENYKNVIEKASVNKLDPNDQPVDGMSISSELPQLYTVLGTTNKKSDLKLKISKLEAYSRQLCLNLKDLQKNREEITNKTLALSEELECCHSGDDECDISSDNENHLLLHAEKSGCCSICKGTEERTKTVIEKEKTKDLTEVLTISSHEEIDTSECSCCVCCETRISHRYFCENCNAYESTFASSTCLGHDFENFDYGRFGQGDSQICSTCGNIEDSITEYVTMCKCDCDSYVEKRCRGGANNAKLIREDISFSTLIGDYPVADICSLKNCSSSVRGWEEIKTAEDRSLAVENFPKKKLQDKVTKTLTKTLKNESTEIDTCENILENRIKDDYRMKISDFDRAEILKYLETLSKSCEEKMTMRAKMKDGTSKVDLLMGLIVLSSLSLVSLKFAKLLSQQYLRVSENFGRYANFVSSHLTFVGAVLGSISFAKSVWSLTKILYICFRKDSCVSSVLRKFRKTTKRNFKRMFRAKYRYHFFSYLSWLAFGFFVGKMSNVIDKSSWKIVKNYSSQF